MINVTFTYKQGTLIGIWPGKSYRTKGIGSRKKGQIYLGKVIDREKLIFWTRKRGYYQFNPTDQTFSEVAQEDIPSAFIEPDKSKRNAPIIVDFGDSYFLHELINGIGYNQVIDAIDYQNRDSLYAAVLYYTLESSANCHAESWCRQNFASYLYPKANLRGQRFSSMLASIGQPEKVRRFLLAHINFLVDIYGSDLCVIIDSSGLENDCNLPITCFSNHNGNVNLEFRLIIIVQKSTGIPIFYEYVPGNIIDASTLKRLLILLDQYGCHVEYCIVDAGYSCPSNMERLILSGIEFMSRLNPNFNIYKKVIDEHFCELADETNVVR